MTFLSSLSSYDGNIPRPSHQHKVTESLAEGFIHSFSPEKDLLTENKGGLKHRVNLCSPKRSSTVFHVFKIVLTLVWQIWGHVHKYCPFSFLAHSQGNGGKASLWETVRLWGLEQWCSFSRARSGSPSAFPALCLPTLISNVNVILQSYSGSQEIIIPLQGGLDQCPRWQQSLWQTFRSWIYQETASWMSWKGKHSRFSLKQSLKKGAKRHWEVSPLLSASSSGVHITLFLPERG